MKRSIERLSYFILGMIYLAGAYFAAMKGPGWHGLALVVGLLVISLFLNLIFSEPKSDQTSE